MTQANFEQMWRKRFEQYAAFDDDAKIAGWSQHSLQTRIATFLKYWQSPSNQHWLDIGCGAGTYTQILLDHQQQVVALDYSYPTLQKAKEKLDKVVTLGAADVRYLPFAPGVFHGVLCFGVLQALQSPLLALNELKQVLKEGENFWVDALNRRSLWFIWKWLKHQWTGQDYRLNYVSPKLLVAKLKSLGFQEIQIIWLPILPRRYQMIQNILFYFSERFGKSFPKLCQWFSHAYLIRAKH